MAQKYPPPKLDGFEVVDWLGGGGFADVFSYNSKWGRQVAIKVLHRGVDGNAKSSFEAEVRLMAKLSNHPSIVSIFEAGIAKDGRPFLAMEICPPPHLSARIQQRPLSVSKALEVAIQISGAVETAHRLNVLHRDIKPANILFTEFGRPALTDFGISVSTDSETASKALSPLWAPPEQFGGRFGPMGPFSDVYSLAATTWAMLGGRSPMEIVGGDNSTNALRERVSKMTPPSTGRADVPDLLEQVLAVAQSKDPGQRYQSVLEFARALQGVQAQLNDSITPIDVLEDQIEDDYDEEPESDSGTRVNGFHLIDPDEGSETGHFTGPSGGMTNPQTYSANALAVDGTPHESVYIAFHGGGVKQPGLREFTGPAPLVVDDERPVVAQQPPAFDEPKRSGAKLGIIIGALVVFALVAGVALYLLLGNRDLTASGEASPDSGTSATAQDPAQLRVPPVEDAVGVLEGEQATFTWSNPDPQTGDQYSYQVLDPTQELPAELTTDTTVTVDSLTGATCIEVSLVRSTGRTSSSVRTCAE